MNQDRLQQLLGYLGRIDPTLLSWAYRAARAIPTVRARLEREYDGLLAGLGDAVRPYGKAGFRSYRALPAEGRPREELLAEMREIAARERSTWHAGFASGAVYHGDDAHVDFLNQVYAINSQCNPLHADLWPSAAKYEGEIVAMTARMLSASGGEVRGEICGTVTSGGTESILLAMKAYRDRARQSRGITAPEMVLPVTAHAAFDKAAQYFGIRPVRIPVDHGCRADVAAARRAIGRRTVVVVGSAPSFPHGAIDPIEALSELARARGVGFHTDACLGGFVLPWAERLGYPVPPFDFRLPGVTSISADTHKYGYAPKGTSVVLYRGRELRHHQYYTAADWPGGLYFSPTLAGSRPGALSAACWAAMLSVGERGYLESTRAILVAAAAIRQGIEGIDGLRVLGDPLWVIAFAAVDPAALDIYRVLDRMTRRGWALNGLHRPACVHICVTLRHARPGVPGRFVDDLRNAVQEVRADSRGATDDGGLAPIYGLAATVPVRGAVGDMLRRYVDLLYEVD